MGVFLLGGFGGTTLCIWPFFLIGHRRIVNDHQRFSKNTQEQHEVDKHLCTIFQAHVFKEVRQALDIFISSHSEWAQKNILNTDLSYLDYLNRLMNPPLIPEESAHTTSHPIPSAPPRYNPADHETLLEA